MKNTVSNGHTRKHRYFSCSARKGKASWRMRQDHLQEEPARRKNQRCRAENIHPKAAVAGRLPGPEQPIMILPSSHSSAECGSRNEGGSERSSEGLESHDGHLPWPVCAFRLWMRKKHPAPGSSVEQEPSKTKNKHYNIFLLWRQIDTESDFRPIVSAAFFEYPQREAMIWQLKEEIFILRI